MYTAYYRTQFFNRIKNNKCLHQDECWEWNGSIDNRNGWPTFSINSKSRSAVRIAYQMYYDIKIDVGIFKTCRNRNCVNPNHMVLMGSHEYFWKQVKILHKDECWEWQGNIDGHGYGRVMIDGKFTSTHKYAYSTFRHLNNNMFVCHECDNPKCCNPYHLFEGTREDNYDDMMIKGRQATGTRIQLEAY